MTKVIYIISDVDKAVFMEHNALGLRQAGIDLSFILINSRESDFASFLQAHRFKIHFLEVGKLLASWRQILECRRILKTEMPDAVHTHLSGGNFIGLTASWLAGVKKRIYTRHTGLPLTFFYKERALDELQNRLATTIVAISQNTKDILMAQGVSEKKIAIVHHGFDIDRMMKPDPAEVARIKEAYNPAGKYPVVGVIARWLKLKGIQYIIPAFKELLAEYPNAKLCLFNASPDADYSTEIGAMLSELPAGSYQAVAFEKNIYDLYRLFDMYVHVPINPQCEAFGQTYVEALAAGIPSIFTLSGVAREFITEDNAYIVPFEDSRQILAKMKAIIAQEKDPVLLLKNGQESVLQKFSFPQYLSHILPLY
jgi:glycosyltransferase involved in cell wall biosynthesis